MSSSISVFDGNCDELSKIDLEGPIAHAKETCCEYYSSAYQEASDAAKAAGREPDAAAFRFLSIVTGCCLSPDTPEQTFIPMFIMGTGRTFIPADLSTEDRAAIRKIAELIHDASLLARLGDLLWETEKDHVALVYAAKAYSRSAAILCQGENWVYGAKEYHRALQLSLKLGRDKETFLECFAAIEAQIDSLKDPPHVFAPINLMETLLKYRLGDPAKYAAISSDMGNRLLAQGDHYKARYCFEIEAKWQRLCKDEGAELAAKEKVGDSLVAEAQAKGTGANASSMVAAHFLTSGIEALRQARAPKEKIEPLRQLLSEYQGKIIGEMGAVSAHTDITELVSQAEAHVKCGSFHEALLKIAFGTRLSNPMKLREEATQLVKDHPFTYMFGRVLVDEKGRALAKRSGIAGSSTEEKEEEIEGVMFENASRFHWGVRAEGFINPARFQILNDHHPSFQDLAPLVQFNPFIPPEHEMIYLRGLHAGFHGDLVISSHLLAPQVENSIRNVLEINGYDISNLKSDGTQSLKMLGTLLGLDKTKETFGEDIVFELRGHLIEKSGFGFRDRVAHGFVTDDECHSVPALCVWWLVLRLCVMAKLGQFTKKTGSPSGPPDPEASTK